MARAHVRHEDGRLASRTVDVDCRLEDHGHHQPVCARHGEPTLRVMLHLKRMSNISKVRLQVEVSSFDKNGRDASPAGCFHTATLSPSLPSSFCFRHPMQCGFDSLRTSQIRRPLSVFAEKMPFTSSKRESSLPAFPFPPLAVSSSTTERWRGNNAATTFRSRLRRKMAMLVNDGQGKVGSGMRSQRSARHHHTLFCVLHIPHLFQVPCTICGSGN